MRALNSYPAAGPLTGPSRPIDSKATGVKVTLNGYSFTAVVQVSNATPGFGALPHLFTPAETDWDTVVTVQAADPPQDIKAPCAWVRVLLTAGVLDGGDIAESYSQGSSYASSSGAALDAMKSGTTAARVAYNLSTITALTFWRETDGAKRILSVIPGDLVWRTTTGVDADYVAPPTAPDTGAL